MKKIKPSEIINYEGCFLSQDVICYATLLFKENSLIDKDLINSILEKQNGINTYIFISESESELNNKQEMINLFKKEIESDIHELIGSIFSFYSYDGFIENEEKLLKDIFNFFIKNVFNDKFLYKYLKSLYLFNINLFNHSIRTSILSLIITIKANMNLDIVLNTTIGALLHDIGKIKLYCNYPILADDRHNYTIDEQHLLQIHPVIGFNEVKNIEGISNLSKKIILYHHVWEDYEKSYSEKKELFMSYPRYYNKYLITKEDKDICVGIVQISNTYDYIINSLFNVKEKYDVNNSADIINYIFKNTDIIFKKESVKIFLKYFSIFKIGSKVLLSNGKNGIVLSHSSNPKYPIVGLYNSHKIIQTDKNIYITNFIVNENDDNERFDEENAKRIKRYYNM